ncbi:MAG: hypothetical protein FE038_02440 [Thermoplasmata archaeon]|nr:MAG: hypothetical protein FE038_02440 [Thermoplasmata archaeon]
MKNKVLISMLIFLLIDSVIFFSGCINEKNVFYLISWSIKDENGFPSIEINFNLSDRADLRFYDPSDQILYENSFEKGRNTTDIPLSRFSRMISVGGVFSLKVFDVFNNKIFQKSFDIRVGKAVISWYKTSWVKTRDGFCLAELDVKLISNSKTPLYPDNAIVSIDDISEKVRLFSSYSIPPYGVLNVEIPVYFDNVPSGRHSLGVVINDVFNNEIANYSTSLTPYDSTVDVISYTWRYNGGQYSIKIPRLNFLYNYYHHKERFKTSDYTSYVIDETDDEFLKLVCARLEGVYSADDDIDKIDFIASFIQSLPYANDNVTTPSDEYPRYPVETLFEKKGDCEDTSILTAALLCEIGYDVSLIKFSDHMSVGVHLENIGYVGKDFYSSSNGKRYLYLETTGENWPLGKAPSNYSSRNDAVVYPILAKPLLTHEWQAKRIISGKTDIVHVDVEVDNIGSKKADIVQVEGAFFTNENIPLNLVKSKVFSVPSNVKALISLQLNVPHGVSTVLKIRVRLNGEIVDESVSSENFY